MATADSYKRAALSARSESVSAATNTISRGWPAIRIAATEHCFGSASAAATAITAEAPTDNRIGSPAVLILSVQMDRLTAEHAHTLKEEARGEFPARDLVREILVGIDDPDGTKSVG